MEDCGENKCNYFRKEMQTGQIGVDQEIILKEIR